MPPLRQHMRIFLQNSVFVAAVQAQPVHAGKGIKKARQGNQAFIHRQVYLPVRRKAVQQTSCLHHIAKTRSLKH